MSGPSHTDLATSAGLLTYLDNTPFASHLAIPFSEGGGNYTYRIHLRQPYHDKSSFVVKHGEPHIPGDKSFLFGLERQRIEVEALKRVKSMLPKDSLVTVPEVVLLDENASVIIMEDCGEKVLSLKQLMRTNPPSVAVAQDIGSALGEFLATLHAWGKGNQEVLDFFELNQQARRLSALVTYGRLISTLTGQDQLPKLQPTLHIPKSQLDSIERLSKNTTNAFLTSRETLVMGDFWPGNILVDICRSEGGDSLRRLFIVDWELTKPGLAGVDVGQFSAEIQSLRRFHRECVQPGSALLSSFLEAYRTRGGGDYPDVARVAMIHVGAHLVAWTPRVDWDSGEITREVVKEGVECLVQGAEGTDKQVRQSIVGRLVSDDIEA